MSNAGKNLHPLISEMDISETVRQYFNGLELYDLICDKLIIGKNDEEINESSLNCWSFSLDPNQCTKNDIIQLYKSIISSRTQDLKKLDRDQEAIFYTWYDSMSGNFYFSLIAVGWKGMLEGRELPFCCEISQVTSLDCIIEEFLHDPYRGSIPLEELKVIGGNRDRDTRVLDESEGENDSLKVWSIIIPVSEEHLKSSPF